MIVELEDFSLRRIIPQFCEFNSATKNNQERLAPYFWWSRASNFRRFRFILCATLIEKLAHHMHDLPYNKKFIIRCDGKFAGLIGLDFVSNGAISSEVWLFVDAAHAHTHVASSALKLVEDYANTKSIQSIRASTSQENQDSKHLLARNDYEPIFTNSDSISWHKLLNTKVIEK